MIKQIYRVGNTFYIVVTAEKGGEGKSTTAVNLADQLAAAGYEVLIIDLDSQGNVATSLGLNPEPGILDLFMGRRTQREIVRRTRNPRLDLLPSNATTYGLHAYIASMSKTPQPLTTERIAEIFRNIAGDKEYLAEGEKKYDIVVFDVPKEGDELRKAALLCAQHNGTIIVPVKPERLGMQDVDPVLKSLRPDQSALVLPTMYRRTSAHNSAIMAMKKWWGDRYLVFNGASFDAESSHLPLLVPLETDVTEASALQQTLREYKPGCKAAAAYKALATKVINMMEVQHA